jgi:hypothetical protein
MSQAQGAWEWDAKICLHGAEAYHKQHPVRIFVIYLGSKASLSEVRQVPNASKAQQQSFSTTPDAGRGEQAPGVAAGLVASFDIDWPPPTSLSTAPDARERAYAQASGAAVGDREVGRGRQRGADAASPLRRCAGNEAGSWLIRREFVLPAALEAPAPAGSWREGGGREEARGEGKGRDAGGQAGCLSWTRPLTNGLPIIAEYSDCREGEKSEVLWRLVVYGHWLVWGLPHDHAAQALQGVQLFSHPLPPSLPHDAPPACPPRATGPTNPAGAPPCAAEARGGEWRFEPGALQRERRAEAGAAAVGGGGGGGDDDEGEDWGWVPGEPDMFAWHGEGCSFLPLGAAAEAFRAAQMTAAVGTRRCAAHARGDARLGGGGEGGGEEGGGAGEGEGESGESAACGTVVERILIAGTSRSRGVAYALAAALAAAEGAAHLMTPRGKHAICTLLPRAATSSAYPALPQVDHYHLQGSVFSHLSRLRSVDGLRAGMLRCRASAVALLAFLRDHGYCLKDPSPHAPADSRGAPRAGGAGGSGGAGGATRIRQVVVLSLGLHAGWFVPDRAWDLMVTDGNGCRWWSCRWACTRRFGGTISCCRSASTPI